MAMREASEGDSKLNALAMNWAKAKRNILYVTVTTVGTNGIWDWGYVITTQAIHVEQKAVDPYLNPSDKQMTRV